MLKKQDLMKSCKLYELKIQRFSALEVNAKKSYQSGAATEFTKALVRSLSDSELNVFSERNTDPIMKRTKLSRTRSTECLCNQCLYATEVIKYSKFRIEIEKASYMDFPMFMRHAMLKYTYMNIPRLNKKDFGKQYKRYLKIVKKKLMTEKAKMPMVKEEKMEVSLPGTSSSFNEVGTNEYFVSEASQTKICLKVLHFLLFNY